ncbi:MAG: N-carbamoylputrescine amidase [Desulfovibrio sp.]|nr:N-carbamoylputrescine amidase [Desulfovibrio sp.]MCA1987283.1 N-carbamoylputrescine amidase [Desulfovibrio sp.]
MPLPLTLGVVQLAWEDNEARTLDKACDLVRQAASMGAQVICLQELLTTPYFCKDKDPAFFAWARPLAGHPDVRRLAALAAELEVVLPVSFFERDDSGDEPRYYNSCVLVDADGAAKPVYRKTHIPDGPGYEEKFYFAPGNTGFLVHQTRYGRVGVGICWDQWFPEAARAMTLLGADVLLYPTAIGSEPQEPGVDTQPHWQRVMQGHAGANLTPVVAANRVGTERGACCSITFYGTSFITDSTGAIAAQADRQEEAVRVVRFDLDALRAQKRIWGFFRDRRPDCYALLTRTPPSVP